MATHEPLTELHLSATSFADEQSFVALADVSRIMMNKPADSYRVIGGHMMTALSHRWRLVADLYRETGDADIGVPPVAIRESRLVADLERLNYKQVDGSRFERDLSDIPTAPDETRAAPVRSAIDILLPAYTSRARKNKRVGDKIVATEALGLATVLLRPPINMSMHLQRLDGSELQANLLFPDEIGALTLKALVTTNRNKDTDVVDLWRCLEICQAAGVTPDAFYAATDLVRAARITRNLFANRNGFAMRCLISYHGLSRSGGDQRHTRLAALIASVLGSEHDGNAHR